MPLDFTQADLRWWGILLVQVGAGVVFLLYGDADYSKFLIGSAIGQTVTASLTARR